MVKENIIIEIDKKIKEKDITKSLETRPMDIIGESIKRQTKFDKVSTALGKLIILTYLFIISVSFLLYVFNLCKNCYPDFLKQFETLVLIIIGFFFGTRLVNQYIPLNKKQKN